jgi:hypothetical protein
MSEEIHGYLRRARECILSQLKALEPGHLVIWDTGVQPQVNVSQPAIEQLRIQLNDTEALMEKYGVELLNYSDTSVNP